MIEGPYDRGKPRTPEVDYRVPMGDLTHSQGDGEAL